jgi:helix-turn-helix protein
VTYTPRESELLLHAVHDFIVRHRLARKPIPEGYYPLHAKLVSSARGTKTCAPQPQSSPSAAEELIDAKEAAAILRCTARWVRRIRDELDGRNIGGRWFFSRQTVAEYAERKAGQHR